MTLISLASRETGVEVWAPLGKYIIIGKEIPPGGRMALFLSPSLAQKRRVDQHDVS